MWAADVMTACVLWHPTLVTEDMRKPTMLVDSFLATSLSEYFSAAIRSVVAWIDFLLLQVLFLGPVFIRTSWISSCPSWSCSIFSFYVLSSVRPLDSQARKKKSDSGSFEKGLLKSVISCLTFGQLHANSLALHLDFDFFFFNLQK